MGTGDKRILIVDDSATMRQLIRLILAKRPGLAFAEAADGQQALEKLEREAFDLLITDVNMPNLDGLGLIRAVRSRPGRSLPIIIVTTRGGEKDRDRGMELGADAFVAKPLDATTLTREVDSLLSRG
jgi:two-component system, chemotaxis family, chemotaxis protein CheY